MKTLNAKPSKKIRSRKKIVFPDGNIYEGDTVHEVLDGEGEMTFKNGAIYTGGFRDSKEHGYGKLVKGSNVYEGAWKAGKKHGKGVQIYKSVFTTASLKMARKMEKENTYRKIAMSTTASGYPAKGTDMGNTLGLTVACM